MTDLLWTSQSASSCHIYYLWKQHGKSGPLLPAAVQERCGWVETSDENSSENWGTERTWQSGEKERNAERRFKGTQDDLPENEVRLFRNTKRARDVSHSAFCYHRLHWTPDWSFLLVAVASLSLSVSVSGWNHLATSGTIFGWCCKI